MLKKIAIFLFVLLIVQMALYARLYAADLVNQAEKVTQQIAGNNSSAAGADEDVGSYLRSLGISTSVNADELNAKYPATTLFTDPVSGSATISFHNPQGSNFKLNIYDVSKGLVASFANISSDKVVIDKELFASGSYIYKLEGGTDLMCGTFVLR